MSYSDRNVHVMKGTTNNNNHIDGVMVSVLASSPVDQGEFEARSS